MRALQNYLTEKGFSCNCPDLPLTYKELEDAVLLLENMIEEIFSTLEHDEKVHFIGHSTGGLVIRKFLQKTKYHSKIGRCVLIATPNHGSKLADIGVKIKPFANHYKMVKSLSSSQLKCLSIPYIKGIEIAAIAGNNRNLLLGRFLKGDNDGRVEVRSVYDPELSDFIILPYGHKIIHHQKDTAECIERFFKTGKLKHHDS
jgi:pimeloyl-ACP methyl ester carboxylesterase